MQLDIQQRINRSADDVWTVLADEFTQISQWFDGVVRSYELEEGTPIDGCPINGRVCEFKDDPNGFRAIERITHYDRDNKTLTIEVTPQNGPAVLPMRSNVATFTVTPAGADTADVTLTASPELKPHGYVMYPMVRMGMKKAFGDMLKSLKKHVEERPQKAG